MRRIAVGISRPRIHGWIGRISSASVIDGGMVRGKVGVTAPGDCQFVVQLAIAVERLRNSFGGLLILAGAHRPVEFNGSVGDTDPDVAAAQCGLIANSILYACLQRATAVVLGRRGSRAGVGI